MYLCIMVVKRIVIYILGLLCGVWGYAQQLVFSSLDKSDGLADNYVFQLIQLHAGKMAVVTSVGIDVWDGEAFQHIQKNNENATPIRGYRGATHLYADRENRLWVKNNGRVWCYDEDLQLVRNCIPDDADDVFVDDEGTVFFIRQDSLDMLFDLKTMEGKEYRFYASGTVRCLENGEELYAERVVLDSIAHTSLVVADTLRKKFYQLVDSKLCLEFDTQTRSWTELFRSEKLHTIALVNPNTAFIVSHDGLWQLDLRSRKAEQIDQVKTCDGSYLSSSRINTVFAANDGAVWLGTYDHGVLRGRWYTPWYQTGWAYILYMIIGAGLLLGAFLIHRFRERARQRKETLLLQRIQNLIVQVNVIGEQKKLEGRVMDVVEESQEEEVKEHVPAEYAELINRAIVLVEQNLSTQGYTVERLAADLCMDRTGLYKKMTAAIEKTPTAFIRNIRLTHAAELIREGKLTMSEVAERTGFSSASYMSRCFQEEWGKKPSEIREDFAVTS